MLQPPSVNLQSPEKHIVMLMKAYRARLPMFTCSNDLTIETIGMDLTSAQPQVKLSLFRSYSLTPGSLGSCTSS
jgi:hypothetical protein